jgi:hypothetical protein
MAKQTGRAGKKNGGSTGAAAGRGDSITISLDSIAARAQTVLPSADAARVSGLRGLQVLRDARNSGQSRALAQLTAKYGAEDPRTIGMQRRVDTDAALVQHLGAESERAATPPVTARAGTYIVHGRVRDPSLAGVGKYIVMLTHRPGEDDKGPRSRPTDDTGYYKITVTGMDQSSPTRQADLNSEGDVVMEEGMSVPETQQPKPGAKVASVYLRVLDRKGNAVHDDSRALMPRSATVDYVEMVATKGG